METWKTVFINGKHMEMFRFKFDQNRIKTEEFDFFEGQGWWEEGEPPFKNFTLNYYW